MLVDLSPLASGVLQVCIIEGAPRLVDVSPLSKCKSVTLSYLPCLESVKALFEVQSVEIRECVKVGSDVPALGRFVRHLTLGHLPKVRQIYSGAYRAGLSNTMAHSHNVVGLKRP